MKNIVIIFLMIAIILGLLDFDFLLLFLKFAIAIMFAAMTCLISFGSKADLWFAVKILIILSLVQFLNQQLALWMGIKNTRIITSIPYILALLIYLRLLVRSFYIYIGTNRKRRHHNGISFQQVILGLFLSFSILQIFNPFLSISAGILGFLMGPFWFGFFFVGRSLFNKEDEKYAKSILKIISITIGLAGLYGIIGLVIIYPWQSYYHTFFLTSTSSVILLYRMGSTIGLPAVSGMAGMIGFLVTLSFIVSSKQQKIRFLYWAFASLSLILTIGSGSRTAMLALIVGFSLIIFFNFKKLFLPMMLTIIIVFATGLFLLSRKNNMMVLNSINRLSTISTQNIVSGNVMNDKNFAARLQHWSEIMGDVFEHPLGQGVGSWHQVSNFNRDKTGTVADNEYIAILGEFGVLGLFLFIAFAITLWYQCWCILRSQKTRRENRGMWALAVAATLIGVMVMGFTTHPLYTFPSSMLIWLFWGIGSKFMEINREGY